MRRITLIVLVSALAATGACAGQASYGYSGTVTATTVAPDLVYAGPGVQVIADYDYPVFYADNYYWRYDNGYWARSNYYTGGWVTARPPSAVLRIERPYSYRHYRPRGYVSRRPVVRDHRDNRPAQRTYRRDVRGDSYRTAPRATQPQVRDHRTVRPAPRSQPVQRDRDRDDRDHRRQR